MVLNSAFYPTYISVVNLLQSLHFGGVLNHKKRFVVVSGLPITTLFLNSLLNSRYFWIVFTAIFLWEWCVVVSTWKVGSMTHGHM